ncbi:hypothetical protein P4B35_22095 [Pontiellaceae bacterium B12227]|nr:hypothetical protein [Pontiellaceae bacterium B12227]
MNIYLLTLIATVSNVGTIICIKKCKFALLNELPAIAWMIGIAGSILVTQFLLLWADVKGASLGLVISVVIALVMITAAFIGIDAVSGKMGLMLKHMAPLEIGGYMLAILGIFLIGISQYIHAAPSGAESAAPLVSVEK